MILCNSAMYPTRNRLWHQIGAASFLGIHRRSTHRNIQVVWVSCLVAPSEVSAQVASHFVRILKTVDSTNPMRISCIPHCYLLPALCSLCPSTILIPAHTHGWCLIHLCKPSIIVKESSAWCLKPKYLTLKYALVIELNPELPTQRTPYSGRELVELSGDRYKPKRIRCLEQHPHW